MDEPLILADQILTLIRKSGMSKMVAGAALNIAGATLTTLNDISFRSDLDDPLAALRAEQSGEPPAD
jgi:hypothetical protein